MDLIFQHQHNEDGGGRSLVTVESGEVSGRSWRLERGSPTFGFRGILMRQEAIAEVLDHIVVGSLHYWY